MACTLGLLSSYDEVTAIIEDDGVDENRVGVRGEVVFKDDILVVQVDCMRRVFTGLIVCVAFVLLNDLVDNGLLMTFVFDGLAVLLLLQITR